MCFLQNKKRSARDRDPRRQWTRLSWQEHSSSCIYLDTFEDFYHMKPDDFETLYNELHVGETDPRASEQTCTAADSIA